MKRNEEVITSIGDMGLREIAPGYIRFSIKADDTKENQAVHDGFKEFSRVEADNNYTAALRKLLEYWEEDYKYSLLNGAIISLSNEVEELKAELSNSKKEVKNEPEKGTF